MGGRTLRLATRGSPLARWQADHIADHLETVTGHHPEIVEVSTEGDRRRDVPLAEIGGKGVFVKEVQAAVLDGRADLAVHSAKDLPAVTPQGLAVAAVGERADPRDALVGARLDDLVPGAVVATGSPRRAVQLVDLRPDLRIVDLRGNVETRLGRVGEVDAVVVAAAALVRLGRSDAASELLDPGRMLPQVGQGTIAVECRADDRACLEALGTLDHGPSRRRWTAERAFLAELGGDCSLPAGAYAELDGDDVWIRGLLVVDGRIRRAERRGRGDAALGQALAGALVG